MIYADPVWN